MAESASPSPAAAPAPAEDAAAANLRRRKERREAKIRAGGTDRLNKITGLGGGLQREAPPRRAEVADPDEVDISEHYYQPNTTPRPTAAAAAADSTAQQRGDMDAQLRQLLLAQGQQQSGQDTPMNPFGANDPFGFGSMGGMPGMGAGGGAGGDDPMAAMMQQMMAAIGGAGGPGGPGGPGGMGGVPGMPGMDGFPAGFPGFPGMMGQPQAKKSAIPQTPAALWRLVHFAVAISLGLYVALSTPFKGTLQERQLADAAIAAGGIDDEFEEQKRYFFYAFATAETVLLTSRIFLERRWGSSVFGGGSEGGGAGGSLVSMAMGFLPPTLKRNLEIAMQYWQIFSTVRNDLLVCIFVLGVCSWLRS